VSYPPATLTALGAYYVAHGGVNLGIVGDASHTAGGVSYHLGADHLIAGAYSARTARDLAGLTNAASAIDLGRIHDSLGALRQFSNWLVSQARLNAPGTDDMREIIYSPDGAIVLRWDRERGYASLPRPGEADNTHLTHTHISYYRDSQSREKVSVFRRYFEGVEMPDIEAKIEQWTLDGDAAKRITTIGAPYNAEGTAVDYQRGRYAYVAGPPPKFVLIARARLTAPIATQDAALRQELAAYTPGCTPAALAAVEAAARRAEWDRNNPPRP